MALATQTATKVAKKDEVDEIEEARKALAVKEAEIKKTEESLAKLKIEAKELAAKIPPPRQASLMECLEQQRKSRLNDLEVKRAQHEAIAKVLNGK